MKKFVLIMTFGIVFIAIGMFQWQEGLNLQKLTPLEEARPVWSSTTESRIKSGENKETLGLTLLATGAVLTTGGLIGSIIYSNKDANRQKYDYENNNNSICEKCGTIVQDDDLFCPKCGVQFELSNGNTSNFATSQKQHTHFQGVNLCSKCGRAISGRSNTCGGCGGKFEDEYLDYKLKKCPYCQSRNIVDSVSEKANNENEKLQLGYEYLWRGHCLDCKKNWHWKQP
ncbi:MAG: zinc ribbon domain-containing protein [Dehalococcoidales bacterium]|jgi:RNA polymerase subunit RPABC4/transcription elongation factor Spt4|nr:zinc ribbon domain-containing protein [Dehalococcoidales bacterium]MDX9986330.1 zinc ribbon domain-containing protein [Dehalococcoidales bacterium]